MNVENELKKLTIINNICIRWLRMHPHAYMDYGWPGARMSAYHNYRAGLMQRLEDAIPQYVVEFSNETHEALLIDRQYYLDHHDELYPLYHDMSVYEE